MLNTGYRLLDGCEKDKHLKMQHISKNADMRNWTIMASDVP
jgi:hypothetical protein